MTRFRSGISHLKELYYISFIVVAAIVAIFSIWGPGGYFEMKRARTELEVHRARVETLKHDNSESMQSIKALRSDRETVERYARKKGYGRKGEIVQQLAQEPHTAGRNGEK